MKKLKQNADYIQIDKVDEFFESLKGEQQGERKTGQIDGAAKSSRWQRLYIVLSLGMLGNVLFKQLTKREEG